MSQIHRIPVKAPFPWERILGYLSYRSTPGMESVESGRYVRLEAKGTVSVTFEKEAKALVCHAQGIVPDDWLLRVARIFDTAHDPRPADRVLRCCWMLRPRIAKVPGIRVPGCWDPFELCLRVILGQQVSVKAAHTLMGRLATRCPGLDPGLVAEADLSGMGLIGRRIATIQQLAMAVAAEQVRFDRPWEEVAGGLHSVPGFGPWTMQYLGIRLGRDADAFPAEDLGLLRAAGAKTALELRDLAESWRPFRGYAAMYLWMAGP